MYKMEIWPGYTASVLMREHGVFLNVDSRHKVVRTESALDYINMLRDHCENKG